MRNQLFTLALGSMLALGTTTAIYAQDNSAPPPSPSQDQTPAQPQQEQGRMGRGHRGMDPDRQLQHLTKALDLSPDQQSQIKPILLDHQQKMQALWQDQSLSRQDRRSKAMDLQQDTHSKIEAALNDQQKQKFEAMQQRMRNHRRGMQGDMNNPPTTSPQPQQPQ